MVDDILPLATLFPAVLVASLLGGVSSGVFAVILGSIVGWWAFMPPHTIVVPTLSHTINLALYFGSAGLIVWIAEGYRRAEAKRRLLVEELQHRSKNMMAVVQAIVSQSLAANKMEAAKINAAW